MRKIDSMGFDNDSKSTSGRISANKCSRKDIKPFLALALVVVVLVAPSLHPLKIVQ